MIKIKRWRSLARGIYVRTVFGYAMLSEIAGDGVKYIKKDRDSKSGESS